MALVPEPLRPAYSGPFWCFHRYGAEPAPLLFNPLAGCLLQPALMALLPLLRAGCLMHPAPGPSNGPGGTQDSPGSGFNLTRGGCNRRTCRPPPSSLKSLVGAVKSPHQGPWGSIPPGRRQGKDGWGVVRSPLARRSSPSVKGGGERPSSPLRYKVGG